MFGVSTEEVGRELQNLVFGFLVSVSGGGDVKSHGGKLDGCESGVDGSKAIFSGGLLVSVGSRKQAVLLTMKTHL